MQATELQGAILKSIPKISDEIFLDISVFKISHYEIWQNPW